METKDITIIRGNSWNGIRVTVNVNAAPMNLTGYEVEMTIRNGSKKGSVLKTANVANGGAVIENAAGGIYRINPIVMNFPFGEHYYDIELNNGTTVKTYIGGTITII